jgi:hypothetical protein
MKQLPGKKFKIAGTQHILLCVIVGLQRLGLCRCPPALRQPGIPRSFDADVLRFGARFLLAALDAVRDGEAVPGKEGGGCAGLTDD